MRAITKKILPCLIAVITSPAAADFVIKSEHQSALPYGNAETLCFRNALAGKTPLTPEEECSLVNELPISEVDRFYGRFRLNTGTYTLDVRNRSQPNTPDFNAGVVTRRASRSAMGLELALGYVWEEEFRGDLEYLVIRNFDYNANPIFNTAPTRSFSASIKNNTILGNLYYDFTDFDRFRPYLTGGIGAGVNTVKSKLSIGGSTTKRWLTFAWQVGAGVRVSIFTRWFLDFSYRYIRLGTNIHLQPNTLTRFNADYSLNAFSFGFIYLF